MKYVHGHTRAGWMSRTYQAWVSMRERCGNQTRRGYKNWGGRGISVCERWLTFANFLADMGERPDGKSLDRVNNDGNYEPNNCRWATASEQALNRRRRTTDHIQHNTAATRNACAKLSEDQVRYIRRTYVPRKHPTLQELAAELGVSPSLVHLVAKRKAWKEITQ